MVYYSFENLNAQSGLIAFITTLYPKSQQVLKSADDALAQK